MSSLRLLAVSTPGPPPSGQPRAAAAAPARPFKRRRGCPRRAGGKAPGKAGPGPGGQGWCLRGRARSPRSSQPPGEGSKIPNRKSGGAGGFSPGKALGDLGIAKQDGTLKMQ